MKILKLAWRNVFRHTRRTIITAIAISVGLAARITIDTLMNGVDKMAAENIIDFETSHLEIFAKGYYREERFFPLDNIIEKPELIQDKIKGIRSIRAVAPRVKFQTRINNGIDELPVLGIGVDIEKEKTVFKTTNSLVAGEFLNAPDGILIGTDLARDMNLEVGSYVTIIAKDRYGAYDARDFTVSGLINTGHPLLDGNAAIMRIDMAQQLLAMPGMVTELCVRSRSDNRVIELKEEIATAIGTDSEVYTWKELNASIFEIQGFKRTMQGMLVLIIVIIAAVGIVNTMLMAVMERIPEIGTLRAMGFGNNNIVRMFLYEGGIIGMFGSLLGCLLGFLMSLYLVFRGIDFSGIFGDLDFAFPVQFMFKGQIDYMTILYAFIFGVIVSVLVTLLPTRRATKIEPVEALRHV
jgi:ABC-type lipoprotein release transport system permease subunit